MFFGKPFGPMAAPAPVAAAGAPYAAPIPPSGLLNMDMGGPALPMVEETAMEHHACRIHVVLKGDTVYKLSRTYNIDMQAIIVANNLRYPSVLYPGQRLVIPDGLHYSNY